jgi:hypothetical protein
MRDPQTDDRAVRAARGDFDTAVQRAVIRPQDPDPTLHRYLAKVGLGAAVVAFIAWQVAHAAWSALGFPAY